MGEIQEHWPEPIVRVQSLSDCGSTVIPDRYVKPPSQRPSFNSGDEAEIPLIDLSGLDGDENLRASTLNKIFEACTEWGFFQVVNHGVNPDLLRRTREAWRQFFHLPTEIKQEYANTPKTYEGYGSRVGVVKGTILDWSDYFFLNILPNSVKDHKKWPGQPTSCREETEEYGKELVKLGGRLNKILSMNLGLDEEFLGKKFGNYEEIGANMRVNIFPKCPQPDLTLGLSPHSDPGGMTLLLPDENVAGLQVRKGDDWVTVKPVADAIIVNIGDQLQILTNAIYKSVEHRVIVNSAKERVSLALFYNPNGSFVIEPAKELVTPDRPALYPPMTFNEYKLYIRRKGLLGKAQMDSLKYTRGN